MAGGGCSAVLFLTFNLILISNIAYSDLIDSENIYLRYDVTGGVSHDLMLRPLTRLRREEPLDNEKGKDGEKPSITEKKTTFPVKTKGSKAPASVAKTKLALAKNLTATTSPSVETSSNVFGNATTTTTTTTTTTSSPSITTSVPITTNATFGIDESVKNATGGIMPAPDITTVSSNGTAYGGSENDDAIANQDGTTKPEDNDPDSGGDTLDTITGFNTDNTTIDHHRYYQSQTIKGDEEVQRYWVNLDLLEEEKVVKNEMLSDSHRRAATVTLSFDFPFYGHLLRNITIATGGFLFTGDFVHTWLAATQYIAPLMANFDTSVSKDACVKYADNGTSFIVQWDNVVLKDYQDAGNFTFQVTLHKTGDIRFTYKQIPVVVTQIGDEQHPVKVGLSDAYIVDRTIFYVRRKTIYEYHKIDMKKTSLIGNWTTILFKALPTCVSLRTCETCLSEKISFQCQWCNKIGRCSNGLDRNRQDWLYNGCESHSVQNSNDCVGLEAPPTWPSESDSSVDTFGQNANVEPYKKAASDSQGLDAAEYKKGIVSDGGEPDSLAHTSGREEGDGEGGTSVGGVVAVVFLVGLVLGIGGWVTYAYFYPHSASGQLLIRYRPSTWSWRRGEARYTAASIHSIHM